MTHRNVHFLHINPRVAELMTGSGGVDPELVTGSWVRVPELIAALHVEAEQDPLGAEALLAVADGLAAAVARLTTSS